MSTQMIGLAGWTVKLAEWSSVELAAVPEATMPAVVAAVSCVAMMGPVVVVLAAVVPALVAPSVVVLAAMVPAVVAPSVVVLAAVVPAVVAPSVVVLAAVVPAVVAPSVVVLPAVVAPSVVVLAAVVPAVVAPSVVMLAAVVPAEVAPSVVMLAVVVPAASGRCPVPASDAAPQRLAPSSKGRGRSRTCRHGCRQSGIGQRHRLLVLSPLVASLACRCQVDPCAGRDAPRSPWWHCCVG